jgi:hypothetical protein
LIIPPTSLQPRPSLATTITHIGIVSHDSTAPSDGHQTSILGRLGTRRLGIVISTILSVVWPSQGSSLDFPWLDSSEIALLKLVRLPLQNLRTGSAPCKGTSIHFLTSRYSIIFFVDMCSL